MENEENSTWRKLIGQELSDQGEAWVDVVACTLSPTELDVEFDEGFGSTHGKPFTLWTSRRVYFPGMYDGSEWCASVPRDPCDECTKHIGGS